MTPRDRADTSISRLIAMFSVATEQLERIVIEAMASGRMGTARYKRQRLTQVSAILSELHHDALPLAENSLRESFRVGWATAGQPAADLVAAFGSGLNVPGLDEINRNLEHNLGDAIITVGRKTQDALRQATLEQVAQHMIQGTTYREAHKALQKRLIDQGITGFVDKAGRRWTLDNYTEMAILTTTREAVTQGTVNGLEASGADLYDVTKHLNSCIICQPYEGRTFSLSGNDPEYPKADKLPPYHPRCAHVMRPSSVTLNRIEQSLVAV